MNFSLLILAYGYCGFINNFHRVRCCIDLGNLMFIKFQYHWPQIDGSLKM